VERAAREGRKLAATAGQDAHQNAIPIMLADGERGDSYRRVLRWFGNIAIVADPHDPAQIEQAMATGRIFTVIEMLGTPANFDVRATDEAGAVYEIGATVPRNSRLTIDVPTVRNLDPDLPAPVIGHAPTGSSPAATSTS